MITKEETWDSGMDWVVGITFPCVWQNGDSSFFFSGFFGLSGTTSLEMEITSFLTSHPLSHESPLCLLVWCIGLGFGSSL